MKNKIKITNLSEWALFFYLKKNPGATQKKIINELNVKHGQIYLVMNRLINKNIVIKKNNVKDKRETLYYLNDK